jgi:hypothetical protein
MHPVRRKGIGPAHRPFDHKEDQASDDDAKDK